MSTAILKNAVSGEVVNAKSAKGRTKSGGIMKVWVDEKGAPICAIGGERPLWEPLAIDGAAFVDTTNRVPRYPVGQLSR